MITNFHNFLFEFNRKDINLIKSEEISNSFTISFEIELECNDDSIPTTIHEKDLIEELRNKLYSLLENENIDYSSKLFFIEELTNSIDFNDEDESLEILNWDNYEDNLEVIIVHYASEIFENIFERLDNVGKTLSEEDKLNYLISKVKEYLPILYNKYEDNLEFVLDPTLDKGIEIKQKTYINGINNSIIFINDFFDSFNKQNYFLFTKKTGLHINIGIDDDVKWNIVKGMVLLKDIKKDNMPFVYKDITWRMNTDFTDSIFNQLELDKNKIDLTDINKSEEYISNEIEKVFKDVGPKHFAFNISKIKENNYVEFRYVGGNINEEIIINKLLYFCYIVYMMTNPLYKRKEYLKNLYKLFDNLD